MSARQTGFSLLLALIAASSMRVRPAIFLFLALLRHAARRLRIANSSASFGCDFGAEVLSEMAGKDI
jgi:hypothetical protein